MNMSGELLVIERKAAVGKKPNCATDAPSSRAEMPDRLVAVQNSVASFPPGRETAVPASIIAEVSSTAASSEATFGDWVQLTKPRIVVMVLVTASVAAVVASGGDFSAALLINTLIGTGLVGASAGVMNQIWERQIDRRMPRTRQRPLPAGRVTTLAASVYCGLLGGVGTFYLWQAAGAIPAAWGVATWLTYVAVYTPLKTRTSLNTTVGAVSGALPMMIGYTAAGGGSADLVGWLLVAVLMIWQYPHFMAIAWMYRSEYGEAGFKMTPVVEPTGRSAAWQAVMGSFLLTGVLVVLTQLIVAGPLRWGFAAAMVLVTYSLIVASLRFARDRDTPSARRMMRISLLQLPAAMLVLVIAAMV